MNTFIKNTYLRYGIILLLGLGLGWLIFHPSNHSSNEIKNTPAKETIWTCSMHPQIRQDHAGQCPICGMDLIPLSQNSGMSMDSDAVHFSKDAMSLAKVNTTVVVRQTASKEIRMLGKVQADERLLQSQVAQISGRIERLLVNFTGEAVHKGQLLAIIYSPELITAQQELIEAAKIKSTQPTIYASARERLLQWKLTPAQLNNIESSGKPRSNFEVYATTSGIITTNYVRVGKFVSQGEPLFDVSDLSRVWVLFDAYETDFPFLHLGDPITFSFQAIPGKQYTSKIQYIDPYVDATTRVAHIRVELNNTQGLFKPEMFADGIIHANSEAFRNKLIIPTSAVLWTGKRSIVYVKLPDEEGYNFKLREIELGQDG